MMRSTHGFTTLELLIAVTLMLVIVGSIFTVIQATPDAFAVESELADMHQRLRVGADALLRDVGGAAAIRPYRAGVGSPDPPGTFKRDTITAFAAVPTTYWLKEDASSGTYQLMSSSGAAGIDVPVVDDVVRLAFEYFGDPRPPVVVRPLSAPEDSWTSYGPAPSLAAVPPYAARENCVFVDNGTDIPTPRLPELATAGGTLVPLQPEQLTDGPWCPDAANESRWDADLLRVRAVAVTLRVQATSAALRGPAGALFTHGGTSPSARRWAPDVEARFHITPRGLNHGR